MSSLQQHKCIPDSELSLNVLHIHFLLYVFYNVCIWMFFPLMPPDGEGRGRPDPVQVPQGEPGQRVLPATWCTQTEIWAAGLYESVTLCPSVCSTLIYLCPHVWVLLLCCWCIHGEELSLLLPSSSSSHCYHFSIISEHLVLWSQGDWHPFGIVLLFLPICSAWLISHDKGYALD